MAPRVGFNDSTLLMNPPCVSNAAFASKIATMGANVHRMEFDWGYAQPNPPAGGVDGYSQAYLTNYDAIYKANLAAGVSMVIIPMDAPYWARTAEAQQAGGAGTQQAPSTYVAPPAPARYNDYYALLKKVALRYPKALALEIWNEPNEVEFWHPAANAVDYANLLKGAYAAIKSVAPTMTVLSGGLSNRGISDATNLSLKDAITGIYSSAGAGSFDGISFHAYPCPGDNPQVKQLMDATDMVRGVRDQNGDGAKPLWLTETGGTTSANAAANCGGHFDEATQGPLVATALNWAHAQGDFAASLMHTLYEPTARTDPITWTPSLFDGGQGFGLVKWATQPLTGQYVVQDKPACGAVVQAIKNPPP